MPDLKIGVDSEIPKVTSQFKKLNNEVDKTGKEIKKVETKTDSLGKTMSTAFKGFLIGGAVQKGVAFIADDMKSMADSATAVTRALKEINFLRGERGKELVREIAQQQGVSIDEAAQVAGPIFSANAGRTDEELQTMISNAFFEQRSSGASAMTVGMGTSGLLNASDTFSSSGSVGAQNLLVSTVKAANMKVSEVGILGPMFPAAASAGVIPSEAAAAFAMITSTGVPASEAVTQVIALMFAWAKNGGDMTFLEFMAFANEFDQKKKNELLTETGAKAVATLATNQQGFTDLSTSLRAAGQSSDSLSVQRLNEQISSGEIVGEQLQSRLRNRRGNISTSPEDEEMMSVFEGRMQQSQELFLVFLKDLALSSNVGVRGLDEALGGPLSSSRDINLDEVSGIQSDITNRSAPVQLKQTLEKLDSTINTQNTVVSP